MIDIQDPKDCCGCTACASICTHDAITMRPDAMGFMYPQVDASKCVDCGLCDHVCSFNDHYDHSLHLAEPIAYAARHKDVDEVMKSRSGAAFVAISDYILKNGGVVYGVGYKEHFRVAHKRATTHEERDEFRGSKYVQSDLTGIFRQVRDDLRTDHTVLFSGTPCQTAALNAFVGSRLRQRLVLMDIVCHGVPGPFVWRDYLSYLERAQGSEVCYVNFRDKEDYGWHAHHETFKFRSGEGKKTFPYLFYQPILFRHSCNHCPFTNLRRPSDITIADYWGWERTDATFNADDKGCSLILVNTEKGLTLFAAVQGQMHVINTTLDKVMQTHLREPLPMHPQRQLFEKLYCQGGFEYAARKTGLMGWRLWLKQKKGGLKARLHQWTGI